MKTFSHWCLPLFASLTSDFGNQSFGTKVFGLRSCLLPDHPALRAVTFVLNQTNQVEKLPDWTVRLPPVVKTVNTFWLGLLIQRRPSFNSQTSISRIKDQTTVGLLSFCSELFIFYRLVPHGGALPEFDAGVH